MSRLRIRFHAEFVCTTAWWDIQCDDCQCLMQHQCMSHWHDTCAVRQCQPPHATWISFNYSDGTFNCATALAHIVARSSDIYDASTSWPQPYSILRHFFAINDQSNTWRPGGWQLPVNSSHGQLVTPWWADRVKIAVLSPNHILHEINH